MAVLTTKYSIGDVVYYASCTTSKKQHPCPDCLGSKKWKAISPAEKEYTFPCPRCDARYKSEREISLDYTTFDPMVTKLTIGRVKASESPMDYDYPATYMCNETGIGSGSNYNELKLFESYEEAFAAAEKQAKEANDGGVSWVAEQYNKTLEVCDYQLEDAREKVTQNKLYDLEHKFIDFRKDVGYCETIEEVMQLLQKEE